MDHRAHEGSVGMLNTPYVKKDTIKNYFPLPNAIFDLGLHHMEINIYAYLLRIEDRRTYQCIVSYPRSVFLFPFSKKMKIIRQHLVAMIFFFLIFLLRCRLTNTRADTGLLSAVIVKTKIFSKFDSSFPQPDTE